MPFKKNFDSVNANIKKAFGEKLNRDIEAGLYSLGLDLGAESDHYVPVETADLVNSRTQRVEDSGNMVTLTLGYYQTYAAALHSPKKGSKLDGWKPKPVPSPGKLTGGYNPNARQGWLNVAWRDNGDKLLKDFAEDIKK